MEAVHGVMQILGAIWNGLFSLHSPFFNLTFKQIFLGIFIVLFSVTILWHMIGIGGSVFNDIQYGVRYRVRGARMRSGRSSSSSSDTTISSPSSFARPNSNAGQGRNVRRAPVGRRGNKPLGGKNRS